jgi:ketose-bisphosphate aldolase
MPLEPIDLMMHRARGAGYAVGYYESWNLESFQGVIDAAEQTRSPVIIGFNGAFLSGRDRLARERLTWYGARGKAAAESASVPCGLIFNECPDDCWVQRAVTSGFNLVMPADPEAPLAEYAERVSALTGYAHENGVAVEAEVGELPCGTLDDLQAEGSLTDPGVASDFVAATGVDLLAVSVGNVHIKLDGSQGLDLRRLEKIRDRVPVPLVLHGGTGIGADSLREAIALGVTKVNYGTCLKQAYLEAVRAALGRGCARPHRLLGIGGAEDILVAGRLAVRDAVPRRIGLLGSCGRADT